MGVDGTLNGGGKYLLEVVWTGIEIINIDINQKEDQDPALGRTCKTPTSKGSLSG